MRPYVLTVTLNPAIDKMITIDHFIVGSDHRYKNAYLSAGGKGVNVSQALKKLGVNTYDTGFLGGCGGEFIREALTKQKIKHAFVNIKGETRTSLTILDKKQQQLTRVLENGPVIRTKDGEVFKKKFTALLKGCQYVVIAGRMVPGIHEYFYGELVNIANKQNKKVILDSSGKAFMLGIKARPFMIKPNVQEAEFIVKSKLNSTAKLKSAVKRFHQMGIQTVFISLGARGAIASNGKECWQAVPPKVKAVNTVGCGDSLIAGYLYSVVQRTGFKKAVQMAVATGTANALNMHPGMVSKKKAESIARKIKLSPI